MHALIPVWIIGGPFVGLLILAFSFKGPSAMGGPSSRFPADRREFAVDRSAPLDEPMHPSAPRRRV